MNEATDDHWMQLAIQLAERAALEGEVPVGAVVVRGGELIGQGWNSPISSNDPTAHAEIIALRDAAQHIDNYRLVDTTLYVTLEPCLMCAGAMLHARVGRLVFGAYDTKRGAVNSTGHCLDTPGLNHRMQVTGGILLEQCGHVLKTFFHERRV